MTCHLSTSRSPDTAVSGRTGCEIERGRRGPRVARDRATMALLDVASNIPTHASTSLRTDAAGSCRASVYADPAATAESSTRRSRTASRHEADAGYARDGCRFRGLRHEPRHDLVPGPPGVASVFQHVEDLACPRRAIVEGERLGISHLPPRGRHPGGARPAARRRGTVPRKSDTTAGFSDHERPSTRPPITTGHMPMNRWPERVPARTPTDLARIDRRERGPRRLLLKASPPRSRQRTT